MDLHRRITLVAILVLHVALAAVLLHSSRTTRIENDLGSVSTLILLPSLRLEHPATKPWSSSRVRAPLQKVEPVEIESGSITLPALPGDGTTSADWMTEARKVAAQSVALKKPSTSEPAELQSRSIFPAPAQVAGEQYRDAEGESVVWLTPHCYLVSPAPELGAPNALAHAALPRTVCPGASAAAHGDLFKALPAYEKWDRINPRR